uniref:Uncharacterized protein n=1 Tax=Moniliophthora roreri TaxID=221103 RepID=A0A0W0FR42_MONRR
MADGGSDEKVNDNCVQVKPFGVLVGSTVAPLAATSNRDPTTVDTVAVDSPDDNIRSDEEEDHKQSQITSSSDRLGTLVSGAAGDVVDLDGPVLDAQKRSFEGRGVPDLVSNGLTDDLLGRDGLPGGLLGGDLLGRGLDGQSV